MAPVRRGAPFRGPSRLDWLLRVRRRRAPPPPSPSPSHSPTPVPPPSISPPPSPSPSAEMMPNAWPLPFLHASPGRTPTPSPSVSPTRATSKRKAEESPLAGSDSDGDGETSSVAMAPRRKRRRAASTGPEESPHRTSSVRIPAAPTTAAPTPASSEESPPRTSSVRIPAAATTVAPTPASSETIASSSGEATSAPAWMKAMALLEKIRTLLPSAFRPSYPRTVERGTRSVKEAKSWTCKVCHYENEPTKHLLFDLPAIICGDCCFDPHEGATDFDFCFADLGMNGFCPIGHVKKQIGNTCVANTIASAAEITHRVMMILLEEEALTKYGPFINIEDLLQKYEKRCVEKGCELGSIRYDAQTAVDMLSILRSDGVTDLENTNVHKIADWAYIRADDFTAIITALANGYPLITGFYCGKRVGQLKPGEIYVPPEMDSVSKSGQKPVGHAVVLVGARQEGAEQIVYFLSSSGEWFCQRCNDGDRIRGGIGAIRNKDLCLPPIQILRFNERRTQIIL